MSDPSPPPVATLIIPPDVAEKFGEIVTLIQGSESMNLEERQYWINILPIMTPEQIKNLRDILTNEKEQLAAIDAKYKNTDAGGGTASLVSIEEKMKTKKQQRLRKEQEDATKEGTKEEDLLKQIESA